MKKKLDILIIDDNIKICNSICQSFKENENFNKIYMEHDGESGFNSILKNKPDVVIVDIILPQRDGISILEYFAEEEDVGFRPIFIVLTALAQEHVTKKVLELGADYIVLKPFNMDLLIRRIIEQHEFIFSKQDDNKAYFIFSTAKVRLNKEEYISDILQKMGIPVNLKGYNYLKKAISLGLEDQQLLDSITKFLYPAIAKESSSTPPRVERDIRHALEVAWSKGNGKYYYEIIGFNSKNNEKPTNGAFISNVVEKSKHILKI